MDEEQLEFARATAKCLQTLKDDVLRIVSTGALPVAYIIAFREPTKDQYETVRYISRCTQDCPPGMEKALEEVIYKWVEQTYGEFITVDDLPVFKQ
jgi:hypothetical protein